MDEAVTIFVGDALTVLREWPEETVDCCVTSPPYWGLRDYDSDGQLGLEPSPGEYVEALVAVLAEVRRVLRTDGTLWLNLGDTYNSNPSWGRGKTTMQGRPQEAIPSKPSGGWLSHAKTDTLKSKDLVGIPWRVAFALQDAGWYLRSDIIWSKPNPMPESVTDRPSKAHEYLFLLSKSSRYYYDAEAIAEPARWYGPNGNPKSGPHAGQMLARAKKGPSWEERKEAGATRGNVAFDGNVGAGTQRGVHGEGVSHDLGNGLTRNARSVWTIQTQQFADAHFAVFPEELPRRCILAGCRKGGVVLDPFLGSGTTARVARQEGRQAVGIELNEEYADLAVGRVKSWYKRPVRVREGDETQLRLDGEAVA
jgi:DNA modification methylase